MALAVLVMIGSAVGIWHWRKHRWDFTPEVASLVKQGDILEWRGDTERILVSYPWIRGESYDVRLLTASGATVEYQIEDAQPS